MCVNLRLTCADVCCFGSIRREGKISIRGKPCVACPAGQRSSDGIRCDVCDDAADGSRMTSVETPSGYKCVRVTLPCPDASWIHYTDDGTEGHDSCYKAVFVDIVDVTMSWEQAKAACPATVYAGSHLITFSGSHPPNDFTSATGLLGHAMAHLITRTYYFVGCKQSATATTVSSGWSWIDGTNAGNLNCGGAGCGAWNSNEPNDGASGSEYHYEDICIIDFPTYNTGLLTDLPGAHYSLGNFVCELDL